MALGGKPDRVTALRLTAAGAQRRIRQLAEHSDTIVWTRHAEDRMLERDFSTRDVLTALRLGTVENAPECPRQGHWKCKVTHGHHRGRAMGVVTVIVHDKQLHVVTVEWEDGR
jgi:FAD synthase